MFFVGKPHMHPTCAEFDGYAGPYFHTGGPGSGCSELLSWRLVQWMLRVRDDLPLGAYPVHTAEHNWAGAADGRTRPHPN